MWNASQTVYIVNRYLITTRPYDPSLISPQESLGHALPALPLLRAVLPMRRNTTWQGGGVHELKNTGQTNQRSLERRCWREKTLRRLSLANGSRGRTRAASPPSRAVDPRKKSPSPNHAPRPTNICSARRPASGTEKETSREVVAPRFAVAPRRHCQNNDSKGGRV